MSMNYQGTGLFQLTGYRNPKGLSFEDLMDPPKAKRQVNFTIDPIAIACSLERRYNPQNQVYESLTDVKNIGLVTVDDTEMANKIRDHYSKKMVIWKLVNEHITPFRETLNTIVHNNTLLYNEDQLGVIRKLPSFYKYDLGFETVKFGAREVTERQTNFLSVTLTPVIMLDQNTKIEKNYEYWLSDSSGYRYLIKVAKNNKLNHLYKRIFDKKMPLKYNANMTMQMRNKLKYYLLNTWDIEEN